MWYHLTNDDSFPESLTSLREPAMAFQESKEPRLCIAPTVSQCVIALAALRGVFHVLQLDVENPVPADTTVADRLKTNEHWITQEVIERNSGKIVVHRKGKILIDRNLRDNLKYPILNKLEPGWEEKESRLYEIDEGYWKPKFLGPSEVIDLLS